MRANEKPPVRFDRRGFLKLGGAGLAAAGLSPRILYPDALNGLEPPFLLQSQLCGEEFPFPYDELNFECAERIYNVRRSQTDKSTFLANLNLVVKGGKTLDIKVLVNENPDILPTRGAVYAFYGVRDVLDILLTGFDSPRLFYQVQYREARGSWKAHTPRSFKLPSQSLADGGKITAILISDDHTFDDADYDVPDAFKPVKLTGDYVNAFMRGLRAKSSWKPSGGLAPLKNGFTLAQTLNYILTNEDPDFIINLGDASGIGANYKWKGLGLPTTNLTEADHEYISRILWMRMRKMYSAVTPSIPFYMALGNHDGEESWNSLRASATKWRKKLFAFPDSATFPEGGHPDGNYYAFTAGADTDNRGGAQFIFLDVCRFCAQAPKKPEEWTLGSEQLKWFERVLSKGRKDFSFACFHHVLGGWPAGPDEQRHDVAYGRGPLFTEKDYQAFANPNSIEQVRLTEMAKTYGLNAFLYSHDHIFHVQDIGKSLNGKDLLGVCVGTSKYHGEIGWWKGAYWTTFYGNAFKSAPDFWGPPGISRLTVHNNRADIDYIVSGISRYTNIPSSALVGTVLSSRKIDNPPPALVVDRNSMIFNAVESGEPPVSQMVSIRNGGGRTMKYQVKSNRDWLTASPVAGCSWGESTEITVSVDSSELEEGKYTGEILVESPGTTGSPQTISVLVNIDPPRRHLPLNFKGTIFTNRSVLQRETMIRLTWETNPQDKNIVKFHLYLIDPSGEYHLLAVSGANDCLYLIRNARPGVAYSFALRAVDRKNREGIPALWSTPK